MNNKDLKVSTVHAYKHNGNLYRSWENIKISEDSTDEMLIVINKDVVITEINGRKWKTTEPALWFFFPNEWYNIICMFKEKGINYYCNVASPYLLEDNTIKYIDYDLDLKVFNDFSYKILDLREFNRNRIKWNYSREIVENVWESIDILKEKFKQKEGIFSHEYVKKLWDKNK
ncbi:uncharacterized protein associated with RNAses G and E [Spiroplasma litorale]|uniref:Uncharacterized protein associated with RNAses G and E n=1 Tax=Spiroplasma litorale TaxID=216942 RepID=A0A0K1W2X7_9MOLU|nr:DUF402 domain-containing protein [Spiroplasma litorale]AKX34531.1 uncharacterized protein associated with RNAses G and E [Spiroplasma litorale]